MYQAMYIGTRLPSNDYINVDDVFVVSGFLLLLRDLFVHENLNLYTISMTRIMGQIFVFLIYLAIWIGFITLFNYYFGAEADGGDDFTHVSASTGVVGNDYENLSHAILLLMYNVFRTILGDIMMPKFRGDTTQHDHHIIWFMWIFTVWGGNIIITNLLIAIQGFAFE